MSGTGTRCTKRYTDKQRLAVYVEYANGEREYYDIDRDPYERMNIYSRLAPIQRAWLHSSECYSTRHVQRLSSSRRQTPNTT